jgi:predicted DsbA family dithiol-disulfide isomerase
MTTPLKVDIWSDVQCPWCFIGKRKFEAGVRQFGRPVEIEYHSFELAPDTPVDFEGTPKQYLAQRKGLSGEQVDAMLERVTSIAAELGLAYDYDSIKQTNTVKAHELLHFAKAHGKQLEMKERLLKAYFEQGKHVGHIEGLAELAVEVGLDRAEVVQALTDETYLPSVKADLAQAQAYGINGVPFYVIDGKFGISGAQDPATFAAALAEAATS